ncbi:MAG: AraC family transcriptional regulator, partial [Roseateles sp.]
MSGLPPSSPLQPTALGVFEAMQRSRAQALRMRAVGREGAWLVHWRNADTQTHYQRPGHHTLSLYLQGGEQVRNRDDLSARGGPGRLCSLPAGHASRWDVQGELQLLHIYLPALPLAAAAERWFEQDPRLAGLRERIFFDDPVLAAWGARLAALDWEDPESALTLEHGLLQLQTRLLLAHGTQDLAPPPQRGGRGPPARRRVVGRLETQGPPPTLAARGG